MNDKKHIDRLFQEKLKDFEVSPSDAVWQNISSQMQHNGKSRKVIPLWIKIAGIAASLLLLFTLGNLIFNSDSENQSSDTIVNTNDIDNSEPNPENASSKGDTNQPILNNENLTQDAVASEELNTNTEQPTLEEKGNSSVKRNELIVNDRLENKQSTVVSNDPKDNSALQQEQKLKSVVVTNENTTNSSDVANQNTDSSEKTPLTGEQDQINKSKADELLKKEALSKDAIANTESNETVNSDSENVEQDENKTAITEALEQQEELSDEKDKEEKTQRWSVSPQIAPVYFNSLGNGSPIDAQFNNNPRSGEINMSYGIAANYKINDRLTIRAGINQLNLGYSVDNVIVYNDVDPIVDNPPLRNVKLNSYGQTLSFLSTDDLNVAQVPGVVADNIQSSIGQNFGFIEVPVELKYKLSDKKVNISVIGGFSSLFLNENEVYTTLQGEETLLGEATNIKKTSFSANLGVGFDFKISEKINLNLEPVMKYQLNTFTDTSGNFSPYTLGVQTGLNFKF